jgi:hypothetical protein
MTELLRHCDTVSFTVSTRRGPHYMRASMSQERLSGIALMHIHYTSVVDAVDIVNKFAHKAPRKLKLSPTVLFS